MAKRRRGDRGPARTEEQEACAKQLGIDLDDPEQNANLRDAARDELSSFERREHWPGWAYYAYVRLLEGKDRCVVEIPAELDDLAGPVPRRRLQNPGQVARWAFEQREKGKTYAQIARWQEEEYNKVAAKSASKGLPPPPTVRPAVSAAAIRRAVTRHNYIWELAERFSWLFALS